MRSRPRALAMMGRGRAGGATSPANEPHLFVPSDVLEVAQGYWWDAANSTGFGGTGFRVLEGNGRTPFDLVQATVANQPTLLTENGGTQFRMRKTTDPAPCILVTSGAVQRPWTGATSVMGWFRLPDASGDPGASGTELFQHGASSPNRGLTLACNTNTAVKVLSNQLSGLGTDVNSARSASPFDGSNWVWVEHFFDPLFVLGGSVAADRVKWFANLQNLAIVQTAGTLPAQLFNPSIALAVASFTTSAPFVTTDWAACYYANGIPTLSNRVKLANYHNPTGALLAA